MEQPIDGSIGSMLGGTTRSILFGYFWLEANAESLLKISGSSKDLSIASIQGKNYYIRELSRYVHKNKGRIGSLYSLLAYNWTHACIHFSHDYLSFQFIKSKFH